MNKDILMRRALWVSVAYNLSSALLFAFPSSPLVQLKAKNVQVMTRPPRESPIWQTMRFHWIAAG